MSNQPIYRTVNGHEYAIYKADGIRIWEVYRAVSDGYMGQVRSDGHWLWTHDNTGERSSALDAFTSFDAALRSLVGGHHANALLDQECNLPGRPVGLDAELQRHLNGYER